MSTICEAPTKPKRNVFKPDWAAIRELVLSISVHCTDIAAELKVRRQTLEKHCQKTFGMPFRQWARQVRSQAGQVSLFSPEAYKELLQAYHGGRLSFKDRHDTTAKKLRHVKSPSPPVPGGPSTASPLTERFTHSQIRSAWTALDSKQIDIGVHVPATYVLSVWLNPEIQNPDFIHLYDLYSRGDVHEWRPTAMGTKATAEAVKLFHQELDRRYLNPPKT